MSDDLLVLFVQGVVWSSWWSGPVPDWMGPVAATLGLVCGCSGVYLGGRFDR